MALVHRTRELAGLLVERLNVGDIGCNTGTQSFIWAEAGHMVRGLDINQGLLALARQRSRERNLDIEFTHGSATDLPWATASLDVCLMPELLEHVADWEHCLDEACRDLSPGGVLYISTTNRLCPLQMEFELPLYSWYPAPIKRYCEKLSVTTRPEWVNHAKYPAVNWFTPYQLRGYLGKRGFSVFDRFDVMDLNNKGGFSRGLVGAIRKIPLLRFLGHVATTYTMVVGVRNSKPG
jgi:2-polyprenyl-6-hydroxyphenyl methylase/3-demethylubiquinone-9 3-methyltransferase